MTDKNTVSGKAFLVMHCIGVVLICAAAPLLLHMDIGFIGGFFIAATAAGGCFLTFSRRRSRRSVWVNLLFPVELIVLFSRGTQGGTLVLILLGVWGALAAVYTALVIRNGYRRRGYLHLSAGQLRWILCGTRTLFTVIMTACVLSQCVFYRSAPTPAQVTPCSTESCEASLSRLAVPVFRTLTREDKLEVLSDVCRVEFTELDVSHGFILKCGELDDEDLAQYSIGKCTITINSKHIDGQSSFTLVRAMCHECFHARQHDLLKGHDSLGQYTEEELNAIQHIYREELDDYCTPHEDAERYSAQMIEKDAYAYADEACLKYLRFYGISEEQYRDIRAASGSDTEG